MEGAIPLAWKGGLYPKIAGAIIILHWVLSVYGAQVVCVRLKHLKTKTGQGTDDENKDGSRNVSLLVIQPPNAAASPRKKSYGFQRNVPFFFTP